MTKRTKEIIILIILVIIFTGILLLLFWEFSPKKEPIENPIEEPVYLEANDKALLEKGYSKEEIESLKKKLNENEQEKLLKLPYINLKEYLEISNFHFAKYEEYEAYKALNQTLSLQDVVTQVNLHLNEPFYQTIEQIKNPEEITVLVNKSHQLDANYIPSDLTPIPSFPNLKLRNVAINDFEELLAAAKLDGVILIPYSTYRSYEYQDGLYQKYLQRDPQDKVDTYSARPGHSEHQTGLAIDIRSDSHWSSLTEKDYEWMKQNSYKYGFIIRYTKDNQPITGYKEEPWHIRYIGKEHAAKVVQLNITYDEYYDLYINKTN